MADFSYLLFVIPGFTFLWTYRHFTDQKHIGEFQYAVWSFIYGAIFFLLTLFILTRLGKTLPPVPLNNPAALLGSELGMSGGIIISMSFPLGYVAALFSKIGFFKWLDEVLKNCLTFLTKLVKS